MSARDAGPRWRMRSDWPPYVPLALRRQRAAAALGRLLPAGHTAAPVAIEGRAIARTFWGKAWCENLERYSDLANRLPRGRAYVRNGSVIHLEIAAGAVSALVAGTDVYTVGVTVAPVPGPRWRAICRDCTGAIDSLVELLQGRLSQGVMERLCRQQTGLFPAPAEIGFECSCPDQASMCKHVAAVLYGVGARLDQRPELLFTLRRADETDLITRAGTALPATASPAARGKILADSALSDIFGIELARVPESRAGRAPRRGAPPPGRARAPGRGRASSRASSGAAHRRGPAG